MTTLHKAAQQALKALAGYRRHIGDTQPCDAEIALLDALAQQDEPCPNCSSLEAQNTELDRKLAELDQDEPVQEPVAWMVYTEGGASAYVTNNPRDLIGAYLIGAYRALALYTTPPQRKPLTEEEIDNICRQAHGGADPQEWARNFARAVERAHGIGEQS